MSNVAVITGAGSGVGRAVAWRLARLKWKLALVGRREAALRETVQRLTRNQRKQCLICPCDVGDLAAVTKMAKKVASQLGQVEILVNAAGINVPKRSLEVLSMEDYHGMLAANLHGPYHCVQAFLPTMRRHGYGTIVNIGSEAGIQATPKAGPGYVISKFGLRGLTQAINAEERERGIRACSIFPGDIDTALLDKRPAPPSPEARRKMLQPEDVAECVVLAIHLPARAIVEELIIRPR